MGSALSLLLFTPSDLRKLRQPCSEFIHWSLLSITLPEGILRGINTHHSCISKTRYKFTGLVFNLYNTVAVKETATGSKIQEHSPYLKWWIWWQLPELPWPAWAQSSGTWLWKCGRWPQIWTRWVGPQTEWGRRPRPRPLAAAGPAAARAWLCYPHSGQDVEKALKNSFTK